MKKFTILLSAFLTCSFPAFADPEDHGQKIGRYQISLSMDGVYFLDTATGQLWLKESEGEWKRVSSPVSPVKNAEPPVADKVDQPVSLALPGNGVTISMIQRESKAIQGSSDSLWVHLGDITAGQVFVEVRDINGKNLVERTSLKNKEFLKFKVNESDVYLQITEMVNNLVGEDLCKVHVSFKEPILEEKP